MVPFSGVEQSKTNFQGLVIMWLTLVLGLESVDWIILAQKCLVMGCYDHGNDPWRCVKFGRFLQKWLTVGLSIRTLVSAFSSSSLTTFSMVLTTCMVSKGMTILLPRVEVAWIYSPVSLKLPRFPSTVPMYISSSSASILFIRMLLQIDIWFFYKDKRFGLAEWNGAIRVNNGIDGHCRYVTLKYLICRRGRGNPRDTWVRIWVSKFEPCTFRNRSDKRRVFSAFWLNTRGVDKSLARPTSRCCRTESIVSLERGACSCAKLQVFSCYRGWNEAYQATRAISNTWRGRAFIKFFFRLQGKAPKEITPFWQKH